MGKTVKIIIGIVVAAIVVGAGYIFLSGRGNNAISSTDQNVQQQNNPGNGQAGNGQEGTIPQSGDPCEGTGGNGQIVSVGNKTITVALHDGSNKIVNLTNTTAIRASTGSGSTSLLKTGDRITLAGHQNSDGSFTANVVAICNGTTSGTQPGQ